jgi:hypothetical protein
MGTQQIGRGEPCLLRLAYAYEAYSFRTYLGTSAEGDLMNLNLVSEERKIRTPLTTSF